MRRARYHRTKRSTQLGYCKVMPMANDGGIAQLRCACPRSCVRHRTSLRCTSNTIRVASTMGKQHRIAIHDVARCEAADREMLFPRSWVAASKHFGAISERSPIRALALLPLLLSFRGQHTTNLHHLFSSTTPVVPGRPHFPADSPLSTRCRGNVCDSTWPHLVRVGLPSDEVEQRLLNYPYISTTTKEDCGE